MAKNLPRWALIGGILAGAAAAAVALRRFFRGGYEERPLGEPIAYPAAGSGTGFPQPTSPEHTETIGQAEVPEVGGPIVPREDEPPNSVVGEPFFQPASSAPEDVATPHIAAGAETAGTAATTPERPQDDFDATLRMPPRPAQAPPAAPSGPPKPSAPITETPQPLSPDDTDISAGTFTATRSEPLQRPPTPIGEQQAENNARIHAHQNQLYAAFPGLEPRDIVASEGDLQLLAQIAATRAGIDVADARERLNAILDTGPDQTPDEGIEPDLVEPKE